MIGENLNSWLLIFSTWPGHHVSPHAECTHPFSTCPEESCRIHYHMSPKARFAPFKSGPAMIKVPCLSHLKYNYLKTAPLLDLQVSEETILPLSHLFTQSSCSLLYNLVQGGLSPLFLLNSIDPVD